MSQTEKRLLLRWIAWNALAWSVGIEIVVQSESSWVWIACGTIVGTAQWLALRGCLHPAPAWIAGTCLAWVAGIWAGYAHAFLVLDPYWAGIVGGTLAGLAQTWVLWRRVSWPALWVPSTIVSSTLGWVAGTYVGLWVFDTRWDAAAYLTGGAAGGAVIGVLSAPLLLAIIRRSQPRPEAV
ncbi:MAG: hypothetical protein ABSF54_04240 [Bryobacteraceae bacterium]|jgi:hypothetical protein